MSQRGPSMSNDPSKEMMRQDSGASRQVSGGNNKVPDSAGSGTRGSQQQTQANLKPPLGGKIQMNSGINGLKTGAQTGDKPQIIAKGNSNPNTA